MLEIMAAINAVIAIVYYFSGDMLKAIWHLGIMGILHLSYKADK